MQQSFILIILHISICIHSQLHLWILAGTEADKDSGCIPASGASIPHFVRHCHLYVLFRTGAEHLDCIRCSRPHIRRDCRFFLQPALHPAVLEADFRKKQKCFPSPCCIPPAFTETSGTRSSTYRKPRILKYPAKCGSCLYPCLPPILRNAGCTIPADLWCPYRDGTSVYFISIRSYQCRFFHASADGSRASGNENRQQLRSLILKITCSCILLGCFCCGVLLILGKWIGIFLFKSPLAGNFILTLAWICPFLYTNTVLLSMINGLGKTTCSFLFNLFSLCIRITGVFLFIPAAGISGYLNGLLISQIFLFLCCILRLSVYAGKY